MAWRGHEMEVLLGDDVVYGRGGWRGHEMEVLLDDDVVCGKGGAEKLRLTRRSERTWVTWEHGGDGQEV